jgi:ribosomal protein S18 acetylase RimI-like enzyme
MAEFRRVESDADVALVGELARAIWTEHYTRIIGPGQVEYMLERFQSAAAVSEQVAAGVEYYLLEQCGEYVGYLALDTNQEPGTMFLSKIYVRSQERGSGLGRAAMDFVESICFQRGIELLWLTCNKHNAKTLAWYERQGFRNAGPTVADIGGGYIMDDWRMEKTVEP